MPTGLAGTPTEVLLDRASRGRHARPAAARHTDGRCRDDGGHDTKACDEGRMGRGRPAGLRAVHHGARHDRHERVHLSGRLRSRHHRRRSADRDHPVHPGDGLPDADRREARRTLGCQEDLRGRPPRLRDRVADHLRVTEPGRPAPGLVADRGTGCGAGDPGHRRVDGRHLPGQAACRCLRDPGRGERRVDGGGTPHRGLGVGRVLMALRVRRRVGRGRRHPAVPADRPGRQGTPDEARHEWCCAVGARARFHRAGDPAVQPMGLDHAERRRPGGQRPSVDPAGAVSDPVVDRDRLSSPGCVRAPRTKGQGPG